MISKELLSEVVGHEVVEVGELEKTDTIDELKKMVGLDIDELTDEEAREIAECDRFEYERGN